jgi:DNA-binding Lrp family transcriptional regulator
MVTAIILIHMEPGTVNDAAEALSLVPGISEVYSVAGEWDLAAVARVKRNEELADLVTTGLSKIDGIASTETLIAFRSYSRHDLDRIFSIGMDK